MRKWLYELFLPVHPKTLEEIMEENGWLDFEFALMALREKQN